MATRKGKRGARDEPKRGRGRNPRSAVRRKLNAVLRVLAGEAIDTVARDLGMQAAQLMIWRDRILALVLAVLDEGDPDSPEHKIAQLHAEIAQLTIDNEELRERIAVLAEAGNYRELP